MRRSRWKLNNETHFSGRDLRKLFNAGFIARGVDGDRRRRYTVKVNYAKQHRSPSGCAWLSTPSLVVHIPKPGCDITALAQVFVHELDHTLGLRHREMAHCWTMPVEWSEGFSLGIVQPKQKPKVPVVEQRAAKARMLLAKHEKKLATEKRLVAKYRVKVRYYDKKGM